MKKIHGWTCEHPGKWRSPCGNFVCFQCFAGMAAEQWEVYPSEDEHGELLAYGLTFKEAIAEISVAGNQEDSHEQRHP